MRRAVASLLAAAAGAAMIAPMTACGPSVSRVGPFVTNVSRTHRGLLVESCEIVLRGKTLSYGECGSWTIPLDRPAPAVPPPVAALLSGKRTKPLR